MAVQLGLCQPGLKLRRQGNNRNCNKIILKSFLFSLSLTGQGLEGQDSDADSNVGAARTTESARGATEGETGDTAAGHVAATTETTDDRRRGGRTPGGLHGEGQTTTDDVRGGGTAEEDRTTAKGQ